MPVRIRPYPISAVVVTRGDVPLDPVLESLPFPEVVVWDNAGDVVVYREGIVWRREPARDLAVYGRYEGIRYASHDLIYVQDDDCVLPPESIRQLAETAIAPRLVVWDEQTRAEAQPPPPSIVANMPDRFRPHYPDSCLVGFGAVFLRALPAVAFGRLVTYLSRSGERIDAETFHRTCDVFFTALTRRTLLDVSHADREFASAPNRMWKQAAHVPERQAMLEMARRVRADLSA